MKKALAVILAVLTFTLAFAGCSGNKDDSKIPTDKAVITGSNAISFIEDNYTAEELGLTQVKDEYRFMVASDGLKYNGGKYVKVVANIVTLQEGVTSADGKQTYGLDTVGEYLISFDGTKALMKDMTTFDTYVELENKQIDYSQKEANSEKAE